MKNTNKLEYLARQKGFPGDKIIGVSDSTIFKETGRPELDLFEQRKNDKNLFYMTSDEHILSANCPQIMLVHNKCSYYLYETMLMSELKKGNIHPRDVALIHDNSYRFNLNSAGSCSGKSLKGVYRLNMFTDYSEFTNRTETNKMRQALYIVPLEVDEKKNGI